MDYVAKLFGRRSIIGRGIVVSYSYFLAFLVCQNRQKSTIMRRILRNKSRFARLGFKDISPVLCAHNVVYNWPLDSNIALVEGNMSSRF